MERRQLSDIPAPEFRAVLQHLSCQDYASLRQVSRAVSQLTTQHIPYITLRLSSTSNSDQLQKWSKATRHLRHVASVHIHVVHKVYPHVFDEAVQLLSHPARVIINLHLSGVTHLGNGRHYPSSRLFNSANPAAASSQAFIATLLPLQQLMGKLQTLVVRGIAVDDMTSDLKQLAAASATSPAPWQLRSLVWDVVRSSPASIPHSAVFITVMKALTQAFPQLRQLSISVPVLPKHYSIYGSIDEAYPRMQLAMVQALAAAVLRLKSLEALTVTGLPNIWQKAVHAKILELAAASECFVEPPAAPVTTLDDYGCWLLQHHSQLGEVQISADDSGTGVCMAWQKQPRPWGDVSSSITGSADIHAAAGSTVTLLSINASVNLQRLYSIDREVQLVTDSLSQLDASSSTDADSKDLSTPFRGISSCVIRYLSRYSFKPYADICSRVNSLKLGLDDGDVEFLDDLMVNLKSLKHLEVAVELSHRRVCLGANGNLPLSGLMSAAATIQGLQSLTVHVEYDNTLAQLSATNTLLLPLTAAAGGPGSSLKKLVLSGVFVEPTAATSARVELGAVAPASNIAADQPSTGTAESGTSCRWYSVLRQFYRLQHLTINHGGNEQLLEVAVESLPASLKVFKGRQLNITCAAQHAVGRLPPSSSGSEEVRPHSNCPQLQSLDLRRCHLCDPNSLASEQLQELTVIHSSWPGAWAAAATAWPNIQKLMWKYDSHFTTADGVTSNNSNMKAIFDELTRCNDIAGLKNAMAELAKEDSGLAKADSLICMMLQDIFFNFKLLRTLAVYYLPWWSAEILQPVVHLMHQLRYAEFMCIYNWYKILHGEQTGARDLGFHEDEKAVMEFAAQLLPYASSSVSTVHVRRLAESVTSAYSYGILL